jgi:hypothetical protein
MTGRAWIEKCCKEGTLLGHLGAAGNPGARQGDRWTFDILERSRASTEVELTAPARIAHAKSRAWRRFLLSAKNGELS